VPSIIFYWPTTCPSTLGTSSSKFYQVWLIILSLRLGSVWRLVLKDNFHVNLQSTVNSREKFTAKSRLRQPKNWKAHNVRLRRRRRRSVPSPSNHLTKNSFDDRFDADPFTYEDEELEPPPVDREDEDESQLNAQNGIPNTSQQTHITSGDVRAANKPGSKAIPPEQRMTTPYMTKYEKARILGTRALQIRFWWNVKVC
jgi:RNA polymerase Rpb6